MQYPINSGELAVGGLVPFSTTDFPGMLSAVIFCQGCPWRCLYCHNPHLQNWLPGNIPWGSVSGFLRSRVGLLDAVVFSGGEPIHQPELRTAIIEVKELSFKIGLHTAGMSSSRLVKLLPYVDWVGLDIKATPKDYAAITSVQGSEVEPYRCLNILVASGKEFEVRITHHSELIDETELLRLSQDIATAGVKTFAVQEFRARGKDQTLILSKAVSPKTLSRIESLFPRFIYRGS